MQVKHTPRPGESRPQKTEEPVPEEADEGLEDEEGVRVFDLNEDNEGYPSNYIKTTKYTCLTFLPFSLFKQFARIANIYFLIIAILASIPTISSISPVTAIVPLVFVLLVSMIREGIEDLYRYKSDKASNSKKVNVLCGNGKFEELSAKDLEVGDIVLVEGEDTFAADIVLLKSSGGINAFIQTSSLDGEKNLKKRFVPKGLEKLTKPEHEQSYLLGGRCTTMPPDKDLYVFSGKLEINRTVFPLRIEQLMLKDSKLKNTSWIIGAVAYTGRETKVMKNSQKSRIKVSNLEKRLNKIIIILFVIQVLICVILAIITAIYDDVKDDNQSVYLDENRDGLNIFLNFFSYFLLLATLIPISLIVTLEVVKVIQCYFISQDSSMYDVEADAGAIVSSTTINEELGQVTYVFSDKTGTLTQNIMEFKALNVGNQLYGSVGDMITRKLTNVEKRTEVEVNFKDPKLDRVLVEPPDRNEESHIIKSSNGRTSLTLNNQKERVQEIIKLLSVCHDCEAEHTTVNGENILFYQGASPDEITLVDFARNQGFEFVEANENRSIVKQYASTGLHNGKDPKTVEYSVHRKMPFDSTRKRMSMLVTDPQDGKTKLYTKGADSIIMERLSKTQNSQKTLDTANNFLGKASVNGLRTLLMAMRVIDDKELEEMERAFRSAESDVKNRDTKLLELFSQYEKDLVLIGATCVEDKLQDDVPIVLDDFRRAGIKVWMLTGDKLETAKNIGFSCRLLTNDMEIFQAEGPDQAKKVFTQALVEHNEKLMEQGKKRAIVFDAGALTYLTSTPTSLKHFINIAKSTNAVVLSRASPAQKAEIVRMIKKDDPANITLSIGDGANDVSMILEADIGIGIYGKEGVNAAQAADFAIHQFKFIWNLVLYHGRYNYIRNSELILYFFYKNVMFTMPQVYFAFISDFSAQTVFDDWYISLYNTIFTAFPIIMRTLFEKDIDYKPYTGEKKTIIKEFFPKLYYVGLKGTIFNYFNYFVWMTAAVLHSFFAFIVTKFVFETTILDEGGKNAGIWSFSVTLFICILLIVTVRICVTGRLFNIFHFIAIFGLSLILYYAYLWFSNYMEYSNTYLTAVQLHESALFYLVIFFCTATVAFTDLVWVTTQVNLLQDPAEYMRIVVNNYKKIPEGFEEKYDRLYARKEKQFIKDEIKREKYIYKRRMKRMETLDRKLTIKKEQELEDSPGARRKGLPDEDPNKSSGHSSPSRSKRRG